MKRYNNLYSKICEEDNIRLAIKKASNGKKKRKVVQKIIANEDYYVSELKSMLENKTYIPSPYIEKKIYDGSNKKERIIDKPKFYPDQIIHWCIMLQLEPLLEKRFYYYTCASIKGRGLLRGANYIKRILVNDKKHTKYCLKLDIKKYYPSIDNEILKAKFRKIFKDKDLLDILDLIVDSHNKGIPIGNYTSQWFANFFLSDLDFYIKEDLKVKHYIRYMDDMVLFSSNKKELHEIRKQIEIYLRKENLTLKNNWQLFKVDNRPINFLGYRFFRGYTTLRQNLFLRIRRRTKKIYKKGKLNYLDSCSIISYMGWLKHCNSFKYCYKYVYPFVNIKDCKERVSYESTKHNQTYNTLFCC